MCIRDRSWGGPHQSHEWRLKGPGDAEAAIRHQPRFVTEDMVALRHAALEGIGVVQMPTMVVSDDIRAVSYTHLDVYKRQA